MLLRWDGPSGPDAARLQWVQQGADRHTLLPPATHTSAAIAGGRGPKLQERAARPPSK